MELLSKDGTMVGFAELNAQLPKEEFITKPFFFLPKSGEQNMLTETIEPYICAMQSAVDNYCKYHHNDTNDCLNTFTTYQRNMFKDILTTNANIILDNGLLSFLEPFFTVSRKEIFNILTERFNKYEISVSIYVGSFRPEVACKKSHEGAAEVYKFISHIRENVTRTCCHKYYEIINDLMMSGYVDIEKFGAYIKQQSGIIAGADIRESYMSLCIQCALEMANYDIMKIAEYAELLGFTICHNMVEYYENNKTEIDAMNAAIKRRNRDYDPYED